MKSWIALGCAVLALGVSLGAQAQEETLTYTGLPFTEASFSGNLTLAEANTPSMDTGMIVLSSPLGDNLDDASVTPASYAFDGSTQLADLYLNSANIQSGEPGNVANFEFSTNASGLITQWSVSITGGTFAGTNAPSGAALTLGMSGDTYSAFISNPGCAAPPGVTIPCYDVSENNTLGYSSSGSWQETITPAPEIDARTAGSALTLLAGLMAIVCGRRLATT